MEQYQLKSLSQSEGTLLTSQKDGIQAKAPLITARRKHAIQFISQSLRAVARTGRVFLLIPRNARLVVSSYIRERFRSDPASNQAVSVPIPLTQANKTRQARQAFRLVLSSLPGRKGKNFHQTYWICSSLFTRLQGKIPYLFFGETFYNNAFYLILPI